VEPALHDAGQFGQVPTRTHPQKLRQANVANHCQRCELRLGRKPRQLRFINHRIGGLLTQQELQGLTLQWHALQIEPWITGAQKICRGSGHPHGDTGFAVDAIKVYRT